MTEEATEATASVATEATAPDFLSSIADDDLRGWAEAKGIKTADHGLSSYRNLEKVFGADKADRTVQLLGDEPSAEDFAAFHNKLGRPEAADGYSFKVDEGDAGNFARSARDKFHELGISDTQAAGLVDFYDGATTQHVERTQADIDATVAASEAALQKEWGAAYEKNIAGLDVTMEKLNISSDMQKGLHEAVGGPEAAKFIHNLGTMIGEDSLEGNADNMGGPMSPDAAKIALSELTGNAEFMTAWMEKDHPGHAAAVEKKAALSRQLNGQHP